MHLPPESVDVLAGGWTPSCRAAGVHQKRATCGPLPVAAPRSRPTVQSSGSATPPATSRVERAVRPRMGIRWRRTAGIV